MAAKPGPPAPAAPESAGSVTSADGTVIGYYRLGQGPAVILVHGAGQTGADLRRLAEGLAGAFTVYVPDRRGRGRSGPYRPSDGLRAGVEDLSALVVATGARRVFGLSSGAVIALETALAGRPPIERLALYEPPLSFDGVRPDFWVPRYDREMQQGKLGSALVTVLKGTADRTAFRYVPRFALAGPLNLVIGHTADRPMPDGRVSPRDLVVSVHYDTVIVAEAAGPLERFAALTGQVLLVGGSRSAPELTAALDGLSRVLPGARRARLQGVGHTAADNRHRPALVAAELRTFFS